ncbi:hypothetical protein MMC19_004278 [Ptychographa xylographoides]|nr:hypothetical protein [Ptychographa xylographoides]
MTPQYVLQGTPMWSHVVCSWIFDMVVILFLWRNYKAVARLRRQYFESAEYQMSLHSRSIWLTDIPGPERSDEGILGIMDSLGQTAGVPRAAIGRNVKVLPDLIEEHGEAVRKLESILAKYLKNPDKLPPSRPALRPSKRDRRASHGGKVDAIDYLTDRIRHLEAEIKVVRESVDTRNAMPYGFATYERIEEAHTIAYAARKKHPNGVTIRLAPKPNDLIWNNLALSKKTRSRKRFMNNLWVALLTVVWIVPNAMIAVFLTRLSNLSAIWPAFAATFNGHPTTWAAVQAVAAPALTSLVYLLLPILFRRMSIKAGDMTKTSRERHVTHKLYAFFVFNNLIVFSVVSGIWSFISIVINSRNNNQSVQDAINSGDLPSQIMIALCTVSPFWVTWLLQRNLGAAVDLAQIINLIWIWFARTFMSPTPRQTIEWTAPPAFDYASYYNYFLFYSTVSLCYATVQPIVLPVTFLYFVIDCWLKKYLLLYVFITKTESGGQFWNVLFNRMLFAIFLANCVAAIVVKAAYGSWTMLACMLPLPFVLLAFKIYCSRTFDVQCKYYTKALVVKDPESFGTGVDSSIKSPINHAKLGVKFGHPALYKPLITPMVHAKAQHLLAGIYHGRLDSSAPDASAVGAYSDIAMSPMSTTSPGKIARFAPGTDGASRDMYEIVPEANLDFAYFRNRADFADEHGGSGELFGRPQDLVSERSHTPASFMTGSGGSDGTGSRSGTPAPISRKPLHRSQESYTSYSGDVGVGTRGFYTHANESEADGEGRSRLLGAAQPVGVAGRDFAHDGVHERPEAEGALGVPGLNRWRSGGRGYVGLSDVGDAEDESSLSYDAYRPAAHGPL